MRKHNRLRAGIEDGIESMIAFNLSIDFEMGWGDLDRLAVDDVFYRRVIEGHRHTADVIHLLDRLSMPSTWGVVGACCYGELQGLRESARQSYRKIEQQIDTLIARRPDYPEVLFCRETVEAVARSARIELASHGFLHLVASENQAATLREDAAASVRILGQISGKAVRSFIAPRSFYWPDDAFLNTSIQYVRHVPRILGQTYSDTNAPAKFARLWNDFVRPTPTKNAHGDSALLLYLRIDRGDSLWSAQLRLIRALLASGSGSLYCYTHPHNLDSSESIGRLMQLCELVGEWRERCALTCPPFARELGATSNVGVGSERVV